MKRMMSIFIGVVLFLVTASAFSLAQFVSTAVSHQLGHEPKTGIRIFINDYLLTEKAIAVTPGAPSPIPIPYPNRKESDPTPFPVTGEIYISVMDLAAANAGQHKLESHLRVEGDKLYVQKQTNRIKVRFPWLESKSEEGSVTVNNDGLISSALRELKNEAGEQKTYLPLNDLVKALGGKLKADDARRAYVITVSPETTSLLSVVRQ